MGESPEPVDQLADAAGGPIDLLAVALGLAALLEGPLELASPPGFELTECLEAANEACDLADLAARRPSRSCWRTGRRGCDGHRRRGGLVSRIGGLGRTRDLGATLRLLARALAVP